MFGGNPYDPAVNDVRVKFLGPTGDPIERIAYFDGESGYKANLVTPNRGRYVATLYRNGQKLQELPQEGILDLETPLPHGFVRRDTHQTNRFVYDDGKPYFPVGFNLGWQRTGNIPLTDQLTKMGIAGINWTRIWACNWDGKNPWWPQDPKAPKDQLWSDALKRWDQLIRISEADHVAVQMVLFNHGAFSSKVNPNWPDNPWNSKNGGFLTSASDFFTSPEAKRRAKMWLRYAVARYADSPSLLAWELFNEVEWVDARYDNRWAEIIDWHKEMADYLKEIDPYHHMVTTSSDINQPDLFASMDFYQPHTYPKIGTETVSKEGFPPDKPGFFGEFEPPGETKELIEAGLRDGLYGGMMSNHAGTPMYWDWEKVEQLDLYPEFKAAADTIQLSDLAHHPLARTRFITVSGIKPEQIAGKGSGVGESDWMLLRATINGDLPLAKGQISGLSIGDGDYDLTTINLDSGETKTRLITIAHFMLPSQDWVGKDAVYIFKRH